MSLTSRRTAMARKRYKPEEIVAKLRQVDVLVSQGQNMVDAIRQIGVSEVTYYRWRQEFGGLKTEQGKPLKDLELENSRLRTSGRRVSPSSRTMAISSPTLRKPCAATIPNSARCARNAFTSIVRWRTNCSRPRCSNWAACCSAVLTGTNRIVGR